MRVVEILATASCGVHWSLKLSVTALNALIYDDSERLRRRWSNGSSSDPLLGVEAA